MADITDGITSAFAYVDNVSGGQNFELTPLLTVGDEVALLDGTSITGVDGNPIDPDGTSFSMAADSISFSTDDTLTFAMAGIPEGLGLQTVTGDDGATYYAVFMNHEFSGNDRFATVSDGLETYLETDLGQPDITDFSSTVEGQFSGSRVSFFLFDEDWNAVGAKPLIETIVHQGVTYDLTLRNDFTDIDADGEFEENEDTSLITSSYFDADGNELRMVTHAGLSRFCSGYLSESGFVDPATGETISVYFNGEEVSDGIAFAHLANGTSYSLPGLGSYAFENVVASQQYRPTGADGILGPEDDSEYTVLFGTDDYSFGPGDGEMFMYVGKVDAESDDFLQRNGLSSNPDDFSLYVMRVLDDDGNVFPGEAIPEDQPFTLEWVEVPDAVALGDTSLDPSLTGVAPIDLQTYINGTDGDGALRSTNFRRPEDIHEDPNSLGSFYFVPTGDGTDDPAELPADGSIGTANDNDFGTLYGFNLSLDDAGTPELAEITKLLSGGFDENGNDKGISYDNIVVDSNGNVVIQEDVTRKGDEVLEAENRNNGIVSYNLAANAGVVGTDEVEILFEIDQAVEGDLFDTELGAWETSGIVEVDGAALPGQSSYLFDVQAHSIEISDFEDEAGKAAALETMGGQYDEGGQLILAVPVVGFDTDEPAQMTGLNGYEVDPLVTIGEEINGYAPTGILDGIGAYALDENTVRVLVNSELNDNDGYLYTLNAGTEDELQITGTRISYFDIDKETLTVQDAGLAYDRAFDIEGNLITSVEQIPNSVGGTDGFGRFCSGQYFEAGSFGLVDDLYIVGEEIDNGLAVVLDTNNDDLYLAPYLGRGGWENVTFVDTGTDNFVATLLADDSPGSYIYLWVGEKDTSAEAGFLDRNGLGADGKLYVWAPDSGNLVDSNPAGPDFEVGSAPAVADGEDVVITGEVDVRDRIAPDSYGNGSWVEVTIKDESLAGQVGYDPFGFALEPTLRQEAANLGALAWSRPEDIDTNPNNGSQFVVANTGRDDFADGFDLVGDIMIGEVDFSALEGLTSFTEIEDGALTTEFTLAYDGDADPDQTLRSPDNLDWATNGLIYVQEDRAADGLWGEGAINPSESQIVRIDPANGDPADGDATPVAVMDRGAVPAGQVDIDPDDVGDWESSGILDVSELFGQDPGQLFVFDVQAHSVRGGAIGDPDVDDADPTSDDSNLVEGGQLAFLQAPGQVGPASDSDAPPLAPVFGSLEGETLDISGSDQLVFAGAGDDLLTALGSTGGNLLFAGSGNDTVVLGGGDTVFGDEGDDRFFAQTGGDNLITGGAGADQFWIATGELPLAPNTVQDFTAGEDVLGIAGLGASFEALTLGDGGISFDGTDLVVLTGIEAGSLSAADFAFV